MVDAAYGFTSMLLLALREHPDYVLASFALGGVTCAHNEQEQYKAPRRPTPPELSPQFPLTRDIVRAFGIPIYEVKGVEADDVIGTLATQARARGLHSTIVTGDLDALQLVGQMQRTLDKQHSTVEILAASVRSPEELDALAELGVATATLPWKVLSRLADSPATEAATATFLEDASAVQ